MMLGVTKALSLFIDMDENEIVEKHLNVEILANPKAHGKYSKTLVQSLEPFEGIMNRINTLTPERQDRKMFDAENNPEFRLPDVNCSSSAGISNRINKWIEAGEMYSTPEQLSAHKRT